jgi:tetratricopeptide (TPR) repeat protein
LKPVWQFFGLKPCKTAVYKEVIQKLKFLNNSVENRGKMGISVIVIIVLAVGIGFLAFFLVKNVILPKRTAAAADLISKNKTLQAMRKAKAALEKDPQNAEAHFILGKAYLADKRNEQALREFRSVSRLGITGKDIPETEFRETIAALYAEFHEEEEALKEYIMLIKAHPEDPEYYFRAGKLFSNRNRGDLAEQYFKKAISLNPKEERFRYEMGMLYYLSKRIKEADTEFKTVLRLNPANSKAMLYQGKILKESKDYTGAIPFLEKAARDQEIKLRALVELGGSYMSLKAIDKAVVELERAVNAIENEAEADSLYARYFLAMCFEKTGEFYKAIAQWDKIYAQKKNFKDVGEKLTQYIEYRTDNTEKDSAGKP